MIQIASYVLTEPIVEGRIVVYRGYREPDGAPITAKVLHDEYPSEVEVARIRHEYLMLKSAEQPGVVQALGLEKYRNGLALILADRGDLLLSSVLAEKRLDPGAVLRLAISIADVTGRLHRRHIIHKDIKPQNMLVDAPLQSVTFFDFGIATRLSHELQTAKAPEALEGTLEYISPEQTGRMNRSVDRRTDLYSIGVTLYEMLTGALPFESRDRLELIHSHIARTPVSPHERAPEVPEVVSKIVMKLLSKAAEDRYQRAEGLKADLVTCLDAWERGRTIEPFPLGRQDIAERVQIPQKLYGREVEVATLMVAFDRVSQGAAELLIVTGVAGVGKSVLVNEIHKAIAGRGGYLVAGKFDAQRGRNGPYSAVAQAFGDLARQIATTHEGLKMHFREALTAALGSNGQVLIEIIPELQLIVGPQPPVPELGPTESQNRFTLTFQSALRIFATAEHPLILFLDDMQWADPASLKLLQILLINPESGHLLIIGAYRHDEVDGGHPLAQTLGELKSLGATIQGIMLESLSATHVQELVADALGSGRALAGPLAGLVFEKTHGNPFFVNQLLIALEDDKLITYDAPSRALIWDLDRVRGRLDTDDVVVFMTGRIRQLAPATQRIFALGACIGYKFDLETLSVVSETPPRETAAHVWEALSDGLLVPLDDDYRLLDDVAAVVEATESVAPSGIKVRFRFLHDRVQQAAYALVAEEERMSLHLRIGRLLRARQDLQSGGDDLLDVLRHYNLAATLIKDPKERLEVARWNLAAGKRARAMAAYAAAEDHFAAASAMLPRRSFDSEYELSVGIYLSRAECAYLSGAFDLADRLFDELLQRVSTTAEQIEIYTLRSNLYLTRGKFEEALRTGGAALALFGIALPETEQGRQAAIGQQLAEVEENLAGRPIEELMNAPLLTDPEQRALLKLLMGLFPPMYSVSPSVAVLLLARMVNVCLKLGHSEVSAFAYVTYGFLLSGAFGRFREGYEFGKLALDLNEKLRNAELLCKVLVNFSMYLHLRRPLRTALEYQRRAYHAGIASGDFQYMSYSCCHSMCMRVGLGDDLASVVEEAERFLLLLKRTKDILSLGIVTLSRQFAACLLGRTKDRLTLEDDSFDPQQLLAELTAAGILIAVTYYHIVRLQILFLQEDYAGALAAGTEADKTVVSVGGLWMATELPVYQGLALCALWAEAGEVERTKYADTIESHRAKLSAWAESCPENFHHKHLLLEAEIARIHGDELKAMKLYDDAVSRAGESGIVRDEALANELAAKFHHERGRERVARVFMTDAYYGYLQWGAMAKAEALAESYPQLLLTMNRPQAAFSSQDVTSRTSVITTRTAVTKGSRMLDLIEIMKAAHALSSETAVEKVLERMMRIVVEASGAQRGILLLDRQGDLAVEAAITVNPDKVVVGAEARSAGVGMSSSIVAEVKRTGEALVLGNATADVRFAGDPHVLATRPKSVLCIALSHQGRRIGVLYLENNDLSDTFTPERVELSMLLASQAALSFENTQLHGNLKRVTDELTRANKLLESNVALRAEDLREARQHAHGGGASQ